MTNINKYTIGHYDVNYKNHYLENQFFNIMKYVVNKDNKCYIKGIIIDKSCYFIRPNPNGVELKDSMLYEDENNPFVIIINEEEKIKIYTKEEFFNEYK